MSSFKATRDTLMRNLSKNLIISVLCIVISACGQTNNTSVVLPSQTPSPIPTLTLTPTFTPSPTITLTPFPTLSGDKPYLLIQQDEQVLFQYDANGFGRKIVNLPPDGHIPRRNLSLERIVSPDGKWLAFYTGNFADYATQENLPITLNLLNLNDGNVIKVADVVADGYIAKLEQLAENLIKLDPQKYEIFENLDWVGNSVQRDFEWSIESLSWSPDGRALAFAAQIDGLSSDVYLYNIETGSIQQVENSIQSVFSIKWSPDGQYIVFKDSEPWQIYTGLSLYAVQPGNQVVDNPKKLFYRTWMGGGDWLSPNLMLVADGTDTAGNFNLQALDIRTGQLKPLWEDAVSDYAIDPVNQIIAINTGEFAELENLGVFFVTFNGQKTKVLDGLYWAWLYFRGGEEHRFLMHGISEPNVNSSFPISGDVVGLGIDGKPFSLGQFDYDKISISPNKSWLLMYNNTDLFLYDTNDNLAQTFPVSGIQNVAWRPDSQAIFFSDGKALYILSIPNGKPKLVDECGESYCSLDDIAWLP